MTENTAHEKLRHEIETELARRFQQSPEALRSETLIALLWVLKQGDYRADHDDVRRRVQAMEDADERLRQGLLQMREEDEARCRREAGP